jgi:hypothetical protein
MAGGGRRQETRGRVGVRRGGDGDIERRWIDKDAFVLICCDLLLMLRTSNQSLDLGKLTPLCHRACAPNGLVSNSLLLVNSKFYSS